MKARTITKEEEKILLERLAYNPETGAFWIKKRDANRPRLKVGDAVGSLDKSGYVRIKLSADSHSIPAHRIAWFFMTGEWPKDQIDHRNGLKSDNRFKNLRECNHSQNAQNRGPTKRSASGVKGVSWNKDMGKWRALVTSGGILFSCGHFDSIEAAAAAVKSKREELAKEFTNHGGIKS